MNPTRQALAEALLTLRALQRDVADAEHVIACSRQGQPTYRRKTFDKCKTIDQMLAIGTNKEKVTCHLVSTVRSAYEARTVRDLPRLRDRVVDQWLAVAKLSGLVDSLPERGK